MRRIIPLMLGVTVLLWIAAPASATPPVITEEEFEYAEPTPYGLQCDGFEVLFTASAHHRWMDFFDAAGNPTVTTLHFSFTGALYNSEDLDKTVPYEGRGYWTWDWRDGHGIDTYRYTIVVDGKRVILFAGQDVYNWDPLWFVIHGNNNDAFACEVLS